MRLFCYIPNIQTRWKAFFFSLPSTCATCHVLRNKERGWCIHSSHCARAPESCVYFRRCCTCKLCFAHWSWEQLPEVLSKLPVWEVRGYLQTLPPFQPTRVHAAVSSDDYGSETHMHTCSGISGRPAESLKSYWKRIVRFLQKFSQREDAFSVSDLCVP